MLVLGLVFFTIGDSKLDAAEKLVVIDRFLTMIYSEDKEEAIPIRNAHLKILYYDAQGKRHVLRDDLVSDNNGEIKNITVNVPDEIIRIYFEDVLSRPEGGKIVNSKGITYRPITGFVIPDNRTIDTTLVRFLLNSSVENGREHNYQAIKIWNRYYDMVYETTDRILG
ncbi:hypothetical protein [Enterococcus sp. AZ163]|uniref:hypothetical protein n=1 Tax=Enterococcus sp. AZ163 TaxID=2774638 RepID=UPI003D2A3E73